LGGGSLYFSISPQKGCLNDLNSTLIGTYLNIRNSCTLLIKDLSKIQDQYRALESIGDKADYYYQRRFEFNSISKKSIRKSSLFIFLNKTGFNGMYRENSKGEFNIPFGKQLKPLICDKENLLKVSEVLKQIDITCGVYEESIKNAVAGDFIYFDPPYEPLNSTSSFTQYQAGGFTQEDQRKLSIAFKQLSERGCFVMMSNSTAKLIKELYAEFEINTVSVGRTINSAGAKRGKIQELVITNYTPTKGAYIKNKGLY